MFDHVDPTLIYAAGLVAVTYLLCELVAQMWSWWRERDGQ